MFFSPFCPSWRLEIGGKSSYTGIAPSLLIIIPMEIPKSSQGQFRIPGLEVTIAEEEEEGREKAKSDLRRGFAREKKWGEKPLPKKIVVFLLFFDTTFYISFFVYRPKPGKLRPFLRSDLSIYRCREMERV